MRRDELSTCLDRLLEPGRFHDYCPNGLQVEGRAEVHKVVTGVSASMAFLRAAHAAGADAVFVHHGYFWKGEDARITGMRRARIGFLIEHCISLYAYHLPLDAHPVLGNNAQLASRLGMEENGRTGDQDLVCHGRLVHPCTLDEYAVRAGRALSRMPLVIGAGDKRIERVAWCTGGAQGYFEDAIGLGVDAYVTGEISEQHVHLARESGVAFIAAGHHATERFGVQAVGAHLVEQYGLDHCYIDDPSPV